MHYYLNYSGRPQSFVYPYRRGLDLLSGKEVAQSGTLTLAPWDLLVIEEQE